MSGEFKDSIIRTGSIDVVVNKDDLDNEVFIFDDINGVKINENPEKLTIYYRENGAQSEIIVVSYTDPDGGEYLSDPDPNNTQVNIVVLVGDITSENIGKMIFGSKNASETAGQE